MKHEWEVSNEPARGRLQGNGGQRAAQIGLMESHGPKTGVGGIRGEPAETQLVRRREQHQRVGECVPFPNDVGMAKEELKSRMSRLAGLGLRRKIGPGDQVEALCRALEVRHAPSIHARASGR